MSWNLPIWEVSYTNISIIATSFPKETMTPVQAMDMNFNQDDYGKMIMFSDKARVSVLIWHVNPEHFEFENLQNLCCSAVFRPALKTSSQYSCLFWIVTSFNFWMDGWICQLQSHHLPIGNLREGGGVQILHFLLISLALLENHINIAYYGVLWSWF